MAAPQNIDEAIEQALLTPAEAADQSQSIKERSLKDLLNARDRLSEADAKPHFGLRFTRLIPPGAQ
jgi:hypothetical protein